MMVPPQPVEHVCPECKQAKHGNCDGRTWDFDADDFRACECGHWSHS